MDEKKPDKKSRKQLPKRKQLKNTQAESESLGGGAADAEGATRGINYTCVQQCVSACPWCKGTTTGAG